MKKLVFLCKLCLCMFAASALKEGDTHSSFVHKKPCAEESCEKLHIQLEELSDQHEVNQYLKDAHAATNQEQITEEIKINVEDDRFHSSNDLFHESSSPSESSNNQIGQAQDGRLFGNDNIEDEVSAEVEENQAVNTANEDVSLTEDDKSIQSILPSEESAESQNLETISPELQIIGVDLEEDEEKDNTDDSFPKGQSEPQLEQVVPKRRYFPLLYTIKTLFSSLLSEFGDDGGSQENPFKLTETSTGNLTMAEELIKDVNASVNGSEPVRKTRFQCAIKNETNSTTGEVKIVNSTELLEILNFSKNQKMSSCVLVMFYAPWCHFCARAAPHYNALAKAFPQLDVLAVDTSHFSYLNARFGTVAVPNLMLFHGRSAVRFNHTTRVLENFIQFVTNNTGLEPDKTVTLEPSNYEGPLPSVVIQGRDWMLWLAWTFVTVCSTYGFVRSQYGQSFITRLRVLWQEHQHIE